VPRDGETLGEVMFRGNVVMKGYLKNEKSTEAAFAGGWFHSGDLGVIHPGRLYPAQGPLQGHHHLRRREYFLDRGRGRALQAPGGAGGRRGRQARREMGRDALRLRRTEARRDRDRRRTDRLVPQNLAAYKCPRYLVFAEIPKTSTGKLQKFKLRETAKER
jgi:fatty-acyl-CoA synthase